MEEKSTGWHQTPAEREAKGMSTVGVGAGDKVCGLSSREGPGPSSLMITLLTTPWAPTMGRALYKASLLYTSQQAQNRGCYYPPFTDKKTEAPQGLMALFIG